MLTREQLKQTQQWQALNEIWKAVPARQRQEIAPQFQCLSDFIRDNVPPPPDPDAQDAEYQSALSEPAREFAREREAEGQNLYRGLMQILSRSAFESPEKAMIYFDLKYKQKYAWVTERREELLEILNLVWERLLERGFVPGEGLQR